MPVIATYRHRLLVTRMDSISGAALRIGRTRHIDFWRRRSGPWHVIVSAFLENARGYTYGWEPRASLHARDWWATRYDYSSESSYGAVPCEKPEARPR